MTQIKVVEVSWKMHFMGKLVFALDDVNPLNVRRNSGKQMQRLFPLKQSIHFDISIDDYVPTVLQGILNIRRMFLPCFKGIDEVSAGTKYLVIQKTCRFLTAFCRNSMRLVNDE